MDEEKYTLDEYYDFFKETFNVDLNEMSEDKAIKVIDEINKILDEKLKEEQLKKEELITIYNNKINKLDDLTKQLIEIID